jgi:hypothetical protein
VGRRGTTCSCVSPQSGGEARGARMAAGDGELIRKQAAGEEALGPEAIAVGSGMKLELDEEEMMTEWIPGSEGNREGRRWPAFGAHKTSISCTNMSSKCIK